MKYFNTFADPIGALAQLVEQRTENPCVPGSIPGGTTTKKPCNARLFCYNKSLAKFASSLRSPFSSVIWANSSCPLSLSIKYDNPLLCSSK